MCFFPILNATPNFLDRTGVFPQPFIIVILIPLRVHGRTVVQQSSV